LFWDINGPVLEHYVEHGQTVNSERYSAMRKDKLKPAIRNKRRGLLSKTVLDHMPPLPQSKLFKNSILSLFLIRPILQTWHQVITIPLVYRERHCEDVGSEVMKLNKRRSLGFATNKNTFLWWN
jgi:hypothetical protein